jgi:hypothetical protein
MEDKMNPNKQDGPEKGDDRKWNRGESGETIIG